MVRLIISNKIKTLIRDERGQDLAEYGIALAVIGLGAAAAAVAIAGDVETLWTNAQTAINSAL
jgi:Flp pilus assembly pilin Flp